MYNPLAASMRPNNFSDFIGHENIIKKDGFLRKAIESDNIPSLIFWGPPGSGKTTLAFIISNLTKAEFVEFSAVTSGVKDLREVIKQAEENRRLGIKTILFIDEIHRWNKAQQDALLPHVERGTIILIGATTENPSFSINSALISRSKVVVLEALKKDDLEKIIKKAKSRLKLKIKEDVIKLIAKISNGDARIALNILDSAKNQTENVSKELVKEIIQKPNLLYDKNGDEHYNIISALHKSIRGNDENGALYWLARMIEAGEDPLYVARRLVRFASEDIGMANNSALLLANACFEACRNLGYPECDVHLAHCVVYLAKSKKDITVYKGIKQARNDVRESGNLGVPLHLRNAPTELMKDLEYGKNYKYTPEENSNNQEYLPPELKNKKYIKK